MGSLGNLYYVIGPWECFAPGLPQPLRGRPVYITVYVMAERDGREAGFRDSSKFKLSFRCGLGLVLGLRLGYGLVSG